MSLDVICFSCSKVHVFSDIVPFRADCDACSADLHVCLNCRDYDRHVENQCREDQADPVAVKDRRNLCEYFKPKAAPSNTDDGAATAKARLAALFGDKPASPPVSSSASAPTAADEARRKLDELFKKKP